MRQRDDRYPLQPLSETTLRWQADGSLSLPSELTDDLLLQVRYRATGRQPGIEICPQDGEPIRKFFEADSSGLRFLNLTGVVGGGASVRLRALDCQLEPTMMLLQFAPLPLAEGPLLIVAPHADDASSVASEGTGEGASKDFLKVSDSRIVAHTKMLGGGEEDSIVLDTSKLDANSQYKFFCTFPGHFGLMQGDVKLVD